MGRDSKRIVEAFTTMGFNEAAFRRRFAIAPDVSVVSLFDEESVMLAARILLEENGQSFEAIQAAGYAPVICEVLRLKNCLEIPEVEVPAVPPRPQLLNVPWPLTRMGKREQSAKKRKRQGRNDVTRNDGASTSTATSNQDESQMYQEASAIAVGGDEEPLEEDKNFKVQECLGFEELEEFEDPPLPTSPPPPLPDRQDFEWRIVAEGCDDRELVELVRRKLESLPMSAELVRFPREENAGVLDFVSGPLAEIFFRACMVSSPLLGGQKLSLERQYLSMEVPFVDVLLQQSRTRPVYFRRGGTGWTESVLKDMFKNVVPDGEGIKSLHIFSGSLDALVELSRDTDGDLFFYRCDRDKHLEADVFICRSQVSLHSNDREKEHVEPDTMLTSDIASDFGKEKNAAAANREKAVDSIQKQPQILRDSVQQTSLVSSQTSNISRDRSFGYRDDIASDFGKEKNAVAANREKAVDTIQKQPQILRDSVQQTSLVSSQTGNISRDRSFGCRDEPLLQRCDKIREPHRRYANFSNSYRNRRLVICRPNETGELENLETYLQSLLHKTMPGESCNLYISKENTGIGSLTCSSERAAEAIMTRYIERPTAFVIGGQGLRIYRGREFIRPRAVNKCRDIVADAKPDTIRVWGLPKLPQGLVKAALIELLDRIFARDSSVTACADALIKKFTPSGDSSLVLFYSAAAGNALLACKHPIMLGGNVLRFERYQDVVD